MYAVVQTGGKQYRVTKGDVIEVEKLADAEEGKKVELKDVLMVGDKVGAPALSGASVTAEVLAQKKGPKIVIFKKKRRQNYRRTKGHRQNLTVLKITDIKTA